MKTKTTREQEKKKSVTKDKNNFQKKKREME
jgi:hypothetical protein